MIFYDIARANTQLQRFVIDPDLQMDGKASATSAQQKVYMILTHLKLQAQCYGDLNNNNNK